MTLYPKNMDNRNFDIDFVRGIAIILMVIYHWYSLIDLQKDPNVRCTSCKRLTSRPLIDIAGHTARFIFIFLMGLSISISKQKDPVKFEERQMKRSIYLAFYAIVINITTFVIFKDKYVRFGILHYMSFGMLIITYLSFNPQLLLMFGILIYLTYLSIRKKQSNTLAGTIFGYKSNINTIDLFPISKWLLLSILGYYVGSEIIDYKSITNTNYISQNWFSKIINNIGKYSLEIYMFHWVIIYIIQKCVVKL